MSEMEKEFFEFLDMKRQETLSESMKLEKDDRKDESNILKAKANIYEIYKSLWNAAKNISAEQEGFVEAYHHKTATIPAVWKASLEKAKDNNDTYKILIEEAKLSAVAEINEKFARMFSKKR